MDPMNKHHLSTRKARAAFEYDKTVRLDDARFQRIIRETIAVLDPDWHSEFEYQRERDRRCDAEMSATATIAVDRIDAIPERQRKTQPVNWDRVPAFNRLLHRDALLTYVATLPATIAAHVWLTDAIGTEDLGLSRACDLLDPILPCFVRDPDARQQILDETRDRIIRFADTLA